MSLQDEITKWSAKVHTDAYAMSFGELMNLYEAGELDIHPEFQRFFRWDEGQKSRLVESILLGIPLPSIFVAQRTDGIWDVIDGLQRLATIFQLAGILKNEEGALVPPLILERTKYLPSLQGNKWDGDNGHRSLTAAERLYIKRAKIDVKIIKKESDEASKYELFQRLNTGGSQLSDQEVRNCILISIDQTAYHRLRELSKNSAFQECISLTDKAIEEQFDMELVLRFLLISPIDTEEIRKIGDVGEFLTDTMVERSGAQTLISNNLTRAFERTFAALNDALGANCFKRYQTRFLGGFLISAFEAIAIGMGSHAAKLRWKPPDAEKIRQQVEALWSNPTFLEGIGSGVRASQRLPKIIPLGREYFA